MDIQHTSVLGRWLKWEYSGQACLPFKNSHHLVELCSRDYDVELAKEPLEHHRRLPETEGLIVMTAVLDEQKCSGPSEKMCLMRG